MSNSMAQEASTPDFLTPSEYLTRRLGDQISWYDRKSLWSQRWFKRLRVIEIVAAASIPFLTGIPDTTVMKYVIGGIGVIITVVAGMLALFQFQERWTDYRATCESLKKEKFLFLTKSEPYSSGDAFAVLVQRVEVLISKENTNWTQSLVRTDRKDESESNVAR